MAPAPDLAGLTDLFAPFGPVTTRRMFGGVGIYADGIMFALSYDGAVYLKADEQTVDSFRREGAQPFAFAAKGGRRTVTSYWGLPDRLYHERDELARWARHALAAAQRGAARKRKF